MIKIQRFNYYYGDATFHERSGHSSSLVNTWNTCGFFGNVTAKLSLSIRFPAFLSRLLFFPLSLPLCPGGITHADGSRIALACHKSGWKLRACEKGGKEEGREGKKQNKPSRAIVALFAFSRPIFHRTNWLNRLNLHIPPRGGWASFSSRRERERDTPFLGLIMFDVTWGRPVTASAKGVFDYYNY